MSEDITVQVSDIVWCPFQEMTHHWSGYCQAQGDSYGISCILGKMAGSEPPERCPLRKGRIIVEWNFEE